MSRPPLHVAHLRREFGERVAVADVTFHIDPGKIVALLGPNGAGKTTTVRICATLLAPTSGSVEVAGSDAIAQPRAARRSTGLVLGGDGGFYGRASAEQNLMFFADIAGVPWAARDKRVSCVLDAVGLSERRKDPVRTYSRGMRQRLHIARALLGEPELLLLDEPTTGLDPQAAAGVRTLVRRIAHSGSGVLLTSHHMTEVEQLADETHVLVNGAIVASGSVRDISEAAGLRAVTAFSTDSVPEGLAARLGAAAGPVDVNAWDGRLQVRVPWLAEPDAGAVVEWCRESLGAPPIDLVTRPATLEESYMAVVGGKQ